MDQNQLVIQSLKGADPTMVHQAPEPNPVPSIVDAFRSFAGGGLQGLANQQEWQTPEWSQKLGSVLSSPEANAALGVLPPSSFFKGIKSSGFSPTDFRQYHVDDVVDHAEFLRGNYKSGNPRYAIFKHDKDSNKFKPMFSSDPKEFEAASSHPTIAVDLRNGSLNHNLKQNLDIPDEILTEGEFDDTPFREIHKPDDPENMTSADWAKFLKKSRK